MMWNTPPSRAQAAPLLSFKAGKMIATPIENRFRVEADDRRGALSLEKGGDGAVHIMWKDRQTMQAIDDLRVFPGEQKFEKVDTGRPNDRVYLLTFTTPGSRRLFFWMQEPDATKDSEREKEFNRLMNEPRSGNLNQLQPIRSMMGLGGALPAARADAPAVGLDELSDILSGLGYASTATNETPSAAAPEEQTDVAMNIDSSPEADSKPDEPTEKKTEAAPTGATFLTEQDLERALAGPEPTPSLAHVVTGSALMSLIEEADDDVIESLISMLPEGRQTKEELRHTFSSPQLRQTLVQLSRALNSENIGMVIANFGLDITAGMQLLQIGDGIGAFLASLEDEAEKAGSEGQSSGKST